MHKLILKLFVFFSVIGFLIVSHSSEKMQHFTPHLKKTKMITVGLPDRNKPAYHELDAIGNLYGINVEYFINIARELDLSVNFKTFDSTEVALNALREDSVDIVVSNLLLTKGQNEFIYTDPIYRSGLAAWYKESKNANKSVKQLKWSCIKDSLFCELLKQFDVKQIVTVENLSQGIKLVQESEVDGYLDYHASISKYLDDFNIRFGFVKVAHWRRNEPTVAMAKKENQWLVSLINDVISNQANQGEPDNIAPKSLYFVNDKKLYDYRMLNSDKAIIRYSMDEKIFPIFYRNADGHLSGYVHDYMELLESRSGLEFKYIPNNGRSLMTMMDNDEIDLIPIIQSVEALEKDVILSEPYIQFNYVNVKLRNTPSQQTPSGVEGILIRTSTLVNTELREIDKDNKKAYFAVEKILDDLNTGKIDSAFLDEDLANALIMRNKEDKYYITVDEDYAVHYTKASFGISGKKPMLADVLNSVMLTISDSELDQIILSYQRFNVVYGYDKDRVNFVLWASLILVFIIFLVLFFIFKYLKLQLWLKEMAEKKAIQELKWFESLINELPDVITIRDEKMQPVLNKALHEKFHEVGMDNDSLMRLISAEEFHDIINKDIVIKRTERVDTCNAGVLYINQLNKLVVEPKSQKKFVLSIYQNITRNKEQEAKLLVASQVAKEAMEARSRFLASMSHELRTPIAGTIGLLEMLRSHVASKEGLFILENINTSCNNLHLLVNDILDFSKIDAGELRLDLEKTDIVKTIGETLRLHNVTANEKNLDFQVIWKPTKIQYVEIDALRFSQILNNLLSNAIKFTSIGRIIVKINVSETSLHMEISDTGIGISDSQLKNILEPFIQADDTIARKYGGTGLGLSIVKELIDMMEGTLAYVSKPNAGTVVTLTLPLSNCEHYEMSFPDRNIFSELNDESVQEWLHNWGINNAECYACELLITDKQGSSYNSKKAAKQINISSTTSEFKRVIKENHIQLSATPFYPDILFQTLLDMGEEQQEYETIVNKKIQCNVLVAEDNPINRLLIEKQLLDLSVNFDIVNDGEEAFETLKSKPNSYDLILTDYHMPNIDGATLAKKIRAEIPELHSVKIVGVTAENSAEIEDYVSSGLFSDILYKPYKIKELSKVITSNKSEITNLPSDEDTQNSWLEKYSIDEGILFANIFIDTMSKDVELIRESLTNNDIAGLSKYIHRIKGGAGSIGVLQISELAKDIEAVIKDTEDEELIEKRALNLIEVIEAIVESAKHWLLNNR